MDEKNAYIELVKQNRAKHRAKLKASKEIKELEQKKEKVILKYEQAAKDNTCMKKSLSAENLHYSPASVSKGIPSRMVYMPTMCGMMITVGGFPVRLHHLSWSIIGERLFLQSHWSCQMMDGDTSMKKATGTMIRLEEQRKIKSPVLQ